AHLRAGQPLRATDLQRHRLLHQRPVDHAAARLAGDLLMSRRPRASALVLLLALSATACAGEVGKYRNADPGSYPAGARPAGTPLAGAVESAMPALDAPAGAAAGTTKTAETPAVTGTSAGRRSVTSASGPAA